VSLLERCTQFDVTKVEDGFSRDPERCQPVECPPDLSWSKLSTWPAFVAFDSFILRTAQDYYTRMIVVCRLGSDRVTETRITRIVATKQKFGLRTSGEFK
jgi:hypothetical protein